jgi:RNA methyltransferase, TrmH family
MPASRTPALSSQPFRTQPSRTPLEAWQPVGTSHEDVRRYSRARRNVLARTDRVTAVSGRWAHEAVLRAGAAVEVVLWCPGARPEAELERLALDVAAGAARAFRISERTLSRLQPDTSAPALLSVVRVPCWAPADVLTSDARLVLVADGIEYAGNLGTLVRTADACAADALVLTRATARVTHQKAFAASRGTVLTMPVLEYPTIAGARAGLEAAGFTAYVADPAAATTYRDAGLGRRRTALVVGSEGDGVSPEWRHETTPVSIPMLGRADSLNVAASAAVLLFEARAAADGW